jgi:RNA polymerase sigma-70 factor (ECF subfamily)
VDHDQELMARLQGGDLAAFEALYVKYSRPLLNFFHQMCFDRAAAEDYLQETFLRVWRARAGWRPAAKVSTWLFQIAKNLWFNERAKLRLRPYQAGRGGEAGAAQWAGVADGGRSPGEAAGARETVRALVEAVGGLSEKLRAVFVMARYQGLPYAEIASILEIPEGTVKSRMARAEKVLRERLRPYFEGHR